MILLKFSLINKWRENQNNLYVMKNFILLIHQLFHLTSFSLSLRPLLTASLYWSSKLNWFEQSESESCSVVSNSLKPPGLYSPWNSPSHNTGMGSCSLLQGTFPTQGSNPGLPHCRRILYSGFLHCRRIFFTNWAIREAPFWTERLQFSSLWLWLICMLLFSQK